ncbi:MAG TPA: SBBP repeat-containing protein [Ignavibacteria bacterium]|nr:SBBP repeat-containing protein [Ignavibacteria bacterium]
MKTNLIFFTFLAAVIMVLNVQTSDSQVWVQRYNGTADSTDYSNSITTDASGNVYVTGASITYGSAYYDMVTIKYGSDGNIQWLQKYNGPGDSTDSGNSITVDGSGNVYVTGSSFGSGTKSDFITVKYNSSGVQQWAQRYDGPTNGTDNAYNLKVDASGNVYVTGSSDNGPAQNDYYTIKYNSSGVQQWAQRYNGTGNSFDSPSSLAIDNSGNVYVAGYSSGVGTGYDYVTIKYNSAGTMQWEQRYNGPGNSTENVFSLKVDGSGNVYITGFSGGSGSGNDFATIKYNSAGVQQWLQRYNGSANGYDIARSLVLDDSGNVYVSGFTTETSTGEDYTTIKYNSAGQQQWLQTYNGPGNSDDEVYAMTLDGNGNIYITGSSTGSGSGSDFATIKYNASGTQIWAQRYNGPTGNTDEARSIAVDVSGFVYITGNSRSATGMDFATIKYEQVMGIQNIGNELPENFSLAQNFPNPFNPVTNIRFNVAKSGFVSIKVYDISGKEAAVLVNEELSAGVYNVDLNASMLSSGTYFYRMETDNFIATKKMVLVK